MGEDPNAIRDEIADTRERMGDTIDALGYKADVKSRAKDNVSGKVDTVKERLGLAGQKASDATPDVEQVKGQVRKVAGVAQENPLGLAVGAVAVGFLAGMLVPSSRVEDEKLGPMADQVKEQAKETAGALRQ
jgi:phage-related protein